MGYEQEKQSENVNSMKPNRSLRPTKKGGFAATVSMSFDLEKRSSLKPHVNLHKFSLSTPLHNLCKKTTKNSSKEDVERIKYLARNITSLTKIQDDTQNTPLHHACLVGQELSVVDILLHANPEACLVTNNVGCLPLHNACKCTKPDPSVIHALYASYPEAIRSIDKYGRTPSFYNEKAAEMFGKLRSLRM